MCGTFFVLFCRWLYPLSPRERAGVRARYQQSLFHIKTSNQPGPHPNPLPWGEGTGAAALIAICFLTLAGCQPVKPIVPDSLLPDAIENDAPLPTYTELIDRYNATTKPLASIWAEAHVDIVWLDEKGKRKNEHGDGKFMYVAPDKIALKIEEFGKGFWAGSDGERYWFFDLQDKRTAYVGRFDQLDQLDEGAYPLPVKPTDLLYILGLKPIDPELVPDAPAVELVHGYYLVEPPGLNLRMLLDPRTARPVRVDLLDPAGFSTIKCVLSGPVELEQADATDATIASSLSTQVEVYVLDEQARMTLKLKSPTAETGRIKLNNFNFEVLMRVYKPDAVIDMDTPEVSPEVSPEVPQ